jgi:hypothetical protein
MKAVFVKKWRQKIILAFATGRPLIGTALLNEQELIIQFTEGRLVMLEEL